MKKYFNSSFFRKNVSCLIFVLWGLIPLVWFKNGFLIVGGDSTSSYLEFRRKFNSPTTWNDYTNFGFYTTGLQNVIYSNLTNVFAFIPNSVFQRLLFSFLFFLRLLVYYKLLCFVFSEEKNKILFLPAVLFFALNPYSLTGSISLISFLVPIQMGLVFIFVYKFLNRAKIDLKYLFLISIINSFLFNNPPALSATYIPGGLYFVFNILFQKKKFSIFLKKFSKIILIFIGLNLWYLVPMIQSFLEISNISSIVNPFRTTRSGYLYDHFRLIGQWGWYTGHYLYDRYFLFAENYYKFPLIFSTFGIILLALSLLLFLPQKAVFKRSEKKTFYFFVLLFLFGLALANGGKPPLGRIYMVIYNACPIFWMFREPWTKFAPLMTFSLSVLLYGSLLYFRQKIKNKFLQRALHSILIMVIIVNVYPIFTGEVIWDKWNGSMRSYQVKVPQYWQEMKEYIVNNNLEDYRLLTFPTSKYGIAYNWRHGLSSADDVAVYLLPNSIVRYSSFPLRGADLVTNQLFDKLSDESFDLKKYLSLLNTKYVLQENDVDWRYFDKALSPSESNKILIDNDFEIVKSFGLFSKEYLSQIPNDEPREKLHNNLYKELLDRPALVLYKMSDDYFLPHFYIPQNIIYSGGDINSLTDIVELEGDEARYGVYLPDITDNADRRDAEKADRERRALMERADEVFVKGEWENPIDEKYFEKKESFKKSVLFPYVKHKPGSWEWKLARLKEKYYEWKARKDPEKLIDKKLFYASKRISEFEKFEIKDINELTNYLLTNYKKKMEEGIEEIKKLKDLEIKGNTVIKIRGYWEAHRERIEETGKLENWEGVFEELDEEIKSLEKKFDLRRLEYSFEIPKEETYEVYIKKVEIGKLGSWEVEIDGEKMVKEEVKSREDGWISLEKRDFKEGKHKSVLSLPELENLVGDNWQKLKLIEKKEEGVTLSPQRVFLQEQNVISQPIKDWQKNGLYYLSFDYKTEVGKLGVGVFEETTGYQEEKETVERKKIFHELFRSEEEGKEKKFETILRAQSHALGARICLYALADSGHLAKADVENLRINRIIQPEFLLRKTKPQTSNLKPQTPNITFVKINPTKYKIKVEGAKEPYTLVFSESFHQGWKTYINEIQNDYGKIVASYFDGEIKEGTHRNTFLEKATFETWGKKPMSEDRHLLVNGYANSWYITPEDSNGREDYELIIEFWPQRLFYIGLFISGITLIGCFSYLLYGWMQRRKVARNS